MRQTGDSVAISRSAVASEGPSRVLHRIGLLVALMTTACATQPIPRLATRLTLDDYVGTSRYSHGEPHSFRVLPAATLFVRTPGGRHDAALWALTHVDGVEHQLLDMAALRRLDGPLKLRPNPARGIASALVDPAGRRVLVVAGQHLYLFDLLGPGEPPRALAGLFLDHGADQLTWSPTSDRLAWHAQGRVWVTTADDSGLGKPVAVTPVPDAGVAYGRPEWVVLEEIGRDAGFWWSPDGASLIVQRIDESGVEEHHLADPAHPRDPPRSLRYPRAGTANATWRLDHVPVAPSAAPATLDWTDDALPYLVHLVWSAPDAAVLVLQSRSQQVVEVRRCVLGGRCTTLWKTSDPTYVKVGTDVPLAVPGGWLWLSDGSGRSRIELRSESGELQTHLSPADMDVERVLGVVAGHVVAAVNVDRVGQAVRLFPLAAATASPSERAPERVLEDGTVGPGGWVLSSTGADMQRRFEVHPVDGGPPRPIATAGRRPPIVPALSLERLRLVAGHDVDAAILRPRNMESGRKYPVLLYVYGGPTLRIVQAASRRHILHQWFADHGIIVVSIDGRGTPGAGRNYERVTTGDLVSAPLADQVEGLRLLGTRHPELDMDRVGVMGWSFGGTLSLMALVRHPELFKVGVSAAPVADWRYYDTHYTERYLGDPEDQATAYERSSVLPEIAGLSRPLLLLHGSLDDNVLPVNSYALSDALLKAGRPHSFIPIAGTAHHPTDPKVDAAVWGLIASFLDSHLHFEHQPVPSP
ncbi:MAG: prolyl oligopeptidase family serine peptidase [Myxococcales bacterium]|nr:prolyl oligopeptidase family serine peptidase [Myxococcales bacterium]